MPDGVCLMVYPGWCIPFLCAGNTVLHIKLRSRVRTSDENNLNTRKSSGMVRDSLLKDVGNSRSRGSKDLDAPCLRRKSETQGKGKCKYADQTQSGGHTLDEVQGNDRPHGRQRRKNGSQYANYALNVSVVVQGAPVGSPARHFRVQGEGSLP